MDLLSAKSCPKTCEWDKIHWNSREKQEKSYRTTWWAPQSAEWWIGVLFAIGAILFGLGAFPTYSKIVGNLYNNITFFTGSLFFTSAAFLQYLKTINSPQKLNNASNHIFSDKRQVKIWIFSPLRIDWWSASVQLIGAILYNMSTFYTIHTILTATLVDDIVWTPDAFGSICFLISSSLAWLGFNHKLFWWEPRNISWWINGVNFLGSLSFGISALFAYVMPSTGLPENITFMNLGTFIGAILFFIGAILFLLERTQKNR
ncbi:hypothetical protein [Methanobacterium alcaliphilum]|uniref:hypothetical protein n=1 Tax=Methanobacterium alcaliphilum TaxID=392018 RepID=UPI00200B4CA3|nr:hypothetical protein [Methanobacterium alcaliphilum]MCK9151914.1 hypothetical protein [Methanobacterium alcaliphilum]